MTSPMNEKLAEFGLETWKAAIDVQKHFNTIEMQIRNIAVTVLTATIGAAGLVFSQYQQSARQAAMDRQIYPTNVAVSISGLSLSSSDLIILGGIFAWAAFYLMDRWWYHRLLQGAVKQAQAIENELAGTPYGKFIQLSNSIRIASPFRLPGGLEIRSDNKIDVFYISGAAIMIVLIGYVF